MKNKMMSTLYHRKRDIKPMSEPMTDEYAVDLLDKVYGYASWVMVDKVKNRKFSEKKETKQIAALKLVVA